MKNDLEIRRAIEPGENRQILKHFWFWLLYVCFTVAVYYVQEPDLLLHVTYELASLPAKLLLVYFTVYLVLPRFLRPGRYAIGAGLWLLGLFLSVFLLYWLVGITVYPLFYPEINVTFIPQHPGKLVSPFLDLIIVTSLGIVVNLLEEREKHERERLELARINAQHSLQLLQSQLHPHFLFNTLNGLYAFILEAPDQAANLVVQLSALLRYMLYEGSKPVVSLQRDLEIIQHYLNLEKLRYGPKLDINWQVSGEVQDQKVIPLMLFPFFENAFKHGPSQTHRPSFIEAAISVELAWLSLELKNSKEPVKKQPTGASGLGLQNVRQRLRHHYGDQFELTLRDQEDQFSVYLKIPLA